MVFQGVDGLWADDFRQGNIILDISCRTGPGNYVEELRNLYEGARDDFIAGIQEAEIQQGRKTLVQVNPSYGCALSCLCSDVTLCPDWARAVFANLGAAAVSITRAEVARIALSFPDACESTAYGHPAWRVGKKFFTRIREEENSLVVHLEFDRRARHADRERSAALPHHRPLSQSRHGAGPPRPGDAGAGARLSRAALPRHRDEEAACRMGGRRG